MGSEPERPPRKYGELRGAREVTPDFHRNDSRLGGYQRLPAPAGLKPDAQQMRDLPDDAAPEQQDANHEDDALDHGHPFADAGEIILHPDDDDRAGDRPRHAAEATGTRTHD